MCETAAIAFELERNDADGTDFWAINRGRPAHARARAAVKRMRHAGLPEIEGAGTAFGSAGSGVSRVVGVDSTVTAKQILDTK